MDESKDHESKMEDTEPLLPSGIGLTIPDVQALLAREHGLAIPKDDPALMFITIMNAALTEQAKLQKNMKMLWAISWQNTQSSIFAKQKRA